MEKVIAADPNGDAGQNTAEVAAEADPNGKALKKNTIQWEISAYPKGEHIKMQKITADPIGTALKKTAEMAEEPNGDTLTINVQMG